MNSNLINTTTTEYILFIAGQYGISLAYYLYSRYPATLFSVTFGLHFKICLPCLCSRILFTSNNTISQYKEIPGILSIITNTLERELKRLFYPVWFESVGFYVQRVKESTGVPVKTFYVNDFKVHQRVNGSFFFRVFSINISFSGTSSKVGAKVKILVFVQRSRTAIGLHARTDRQTCNERIALQIDRKRDIQTERQTDSQTVRDTNIRGEMI